MNDRIYLRNLLSEPAKLPEEQLELFALINLGMLESLSNGVMSAASAVRSFFHGENSLFVREHLRDQIADEIMSRGVQLPDLFEVLPTVEAHREFQRELAQMRSLCLTLMERNLVAA